MLVIAYSFVGMNILVSVVKIVRECMYDRNNFDLTVYVVELLAYYILLRLLALI